MCVSNKIVLNVKRMFSLKSHLESSSANILSLALFEHKQSTRCPKANRSKLLPNRKFGPGNFRGEKPFPCYPLPRKTYHLFCEATLSQHYNITPREDTKLLLGGDKDMVYDDRGYVGRGLREFRHNRCLMTPVTVFMFLVCGCFLLVTLVLQVPGLVLGLLLAPILSRNAWYVEFLYPWGIARWAHFFLMSRASKRGRVVDKNRGFHSRTVEQKIEVVPGRVYIHPIPQWVDNIGYLVICLPPSNTEHRSGVKITVEHDTDPIVALMIDCGEASAVVRAIELIQKFHYGNKNIQLQSILSTHKHHDHTGGNKGLLNHELGKHITRVYGGAVERVPYCSHRLTNGEKLLLPRFEGNDMNQHVEIEAVAVPAHTRGSLAFRLCSKISDKAEYIFTGDAMFCGGGGVPFEADTGTETDSEINQSNGNTFLRLCRGNAATERCFAEILSRAMPNDHTNDAVDRILVFPGHEYTSELLSRQFESKMNESCQWKHFAPRDFFETASQMYIAKHRRSLPQNSGKLLTIPSTLKREIHISPHFRSLKRSADLVVRSIEFWHTHFCKDKLTRSKEKKSEKRQMKEHAISHKTASQPRKWNVDSSDVSRDVFTTVYTEDLESIIKELNSGELSRKDAVRQLRGMSDRLSEPIVNKRAIPGFLPSDKNIYRGISGIARLGSRPSAMSLSDSRAMNLPPPIDSNSDRTVVSKKRLIMVLSRLGLLEEGEDDLAEIIEKLWKEAHEYGIDQNDDSRLYGDDIEAEPNGDGIELGLLKWVLYGVPAHQPSWFKKAFCLPCSNVPNLKTFPDHPAASMKQKSGELVSHDVLTCLVCRNATGRVVIGGAKNVCSTIPSKLPPESIVVLNDVPLDEGIEMEELALLKQHL